MADKKYALVGKMVDLIVEPAMHMNGHDLYDRGGNIALTNVMFALIGTGSHDTLLDLFQKMIRTLEFSDFEEFAGELFKVQFEDEEMDGFLGYFRAGLLQVGPSILIDPSRTLDLAFTLAFTLVSLWRRDIPSGEGLTLIHDASSIMEYNKPIWDAAVDVNVPKQEIGYDTRTHVFPLGVTETVAADSKNSIGIQLADVLSGATAAMGRALMKDQRNITRYESELVEILNSDAIYKYAVWPSNNITPEGLGTIGPNAAPIDDFIEILRDVDSS